MNKILISLAGTLLLAGGMSAQDGAVNSGEGFYAGGGFGSSGYLVAFTENTYSLDNPENTNAVDTESLSDSDVGYLFYAGYQINKIIGVEASYTDYGRFQVENIDGYYQEPKVAAFYANAGYTFLNGQLRPFGHLGLGYLQQNQSDRYFDFKDDFVTFHMGLGVDYYPTVLRGLGFRAAFTGDMYVDSVRAVNKDTNQTSNQSLWQDYSLIYVGIGYKF